MLQPSKSFKRNRLILKCLSETIVDKVNSTYEYENWPRYMNCPLINAKGQFFNFRIVNCHFFQVLKNMSQQILTKLS